MFLWVIVSLFSLLTGFLIILLPWTLFFFLFIAISLMLVFLRTELGLMYLLIFTAMLGRTLIGFDFDTSWSNAGTIFPFYVPFLFVMLLVRVMKGLPQTDIPINKSAYVPLTILLAVWGGISLLWTENKIHGLLVQLELILNVFIFLYCMYALKSEKILHKILWFWTCFATLVGLFGIGREYITFGPFICNFEILKNVFLRGTIGGGTGTITRISSINNPNSFALFLNFSIAVALGLWAIEKIKFRRWMLFAIVFFFVLALVLTVSKAGLISFLSLAAYLLILYRPFRKNIFRNSFLCITLFILSIGIGILILPEGDNRLKGSLTSGTEEMMQNDTSFSTRFIIWKAGWSALIKKTAGLGLGPGGFTHYCPPHPHAHSIYFSIIFDFGLVGLFLMLLFCFTFLQNLIIPLRYQETSLHILTIFLSSGMVALAVHGLVDHMYSRTMLWVYSGIVAAASLLSLDQRPTQARSSSIKKN